MTEFSFLVELSTIFGVKNFIFYLHGSIQLIKSDGKNNHGFHKILTNTTVFTIDYN